MAIVNITCIVVDGTSPADGTLPRQPTVQPITWPIGDTGTINFAVTGTDGVVYDLTDQTLAIVCRRHLDDVIPVFAVDAVNDVPGEGDPSARNRGRHTDQRRDERDAGRRDLLVRRALRSDGRLWHAGGPALQVDPRTRGRARR